MLVTYSVSAIPGRAGVVAKAHSPEEAVSAAEGYAKAFLFPNDASRKAAEIEVYSGCARCKQQGRIIKGRKDVRFPKYTDCPECKGSGMGETHYFATLLRPAQ